MDSEEEKNRSGYSTSKIMCCLGVADDISSVKGLKASAKITLNQWGKFFMS